MDFAERMNGLSDHVKKTRARAPICTEEATKISLVLPFIRALGYDFLDPAEVIPEFVADVAGRKGEKIDYAIMHEDKPIILIECKTCGSNLDAGNHAQLHRYFTTVDARIAILTDGVRYKFYSDTEDSKRLDTIPFMEIHMEDVDQTLIPELRKLCKGKFDLQTALDAANELKYNKRIKELLLKQMGEPENGFVEYFFRVVNPGRVATSKAKEQFAAYVKRAFNEFIEERIDQRLKNALAATLKKEGATEAEAVAVAAAAPAEEQNKIKTTDNEMQAYYVVKSLLIGTVESRRVTMRDAQSYCSVLLDDNNRKPIVRLHFNNPERLRIEIITPNRGPSSWYEIKKLDDILQYAAQLREIARSYDAKPADKPELLEPVSDPPAATITLE